jgi:hypothetical protein
MILRKHASHGEFEMLEAKPAFKLDHFSCAL